MTTDSKEHLSELMDGEIGGETGRFVLRRLEASTELQGAWARYHLIRDCMRYQDRGFAGDELSHRVRRAIAGTGNAAEQGATVAVGPRWLRPAAGFAVAAAVAAMAVVAVAPNLSGTPGGATHEVASDESQPFTSPNISSRSPVSRQVSVNGGDNQAAARKMNSYLLRHYQVAGSSGGNGFVSFVPIVISKSTTRQPAQADDEAREQPEQASDPGNQ